LTLPALPHYSETSCLPRAHRTHRTFSNGSTNAAKKTVGQVLEEVLGRRGVTDGLAKFAQRAAKTKGRMDKNAETVLHLMNVPSRADYQKLLVKLEHLQGSLVNVNMKARPTARGAEEKAVSRAREERGAAGAAPIRLLAARFTSMFTISRARFTPSSSSGTRWAAKRRKPASVVGASVSAGTAARSGALVSSCNRLRARRFPTRQVTEITVVLD